LKRICFGEEKKKRNKSLEPRANQRLTGAVLVLVSIKICHAGQAIFKTFLILFKIFISKME